MQNIPTNRLVRAAIELAARRACRVLRSSYNRSPAVQNDRYGTVESLEPRLMMSADPAGLAHWSADQGGNDHYYEVVVRENGISWTDAKAEAEAQGGYLATITSQDENNFVYDLVDDPSYWNVLPVYGTYSLGPWIGGFRPEDAGPDVNEGWQWVTGEDWSYENWTNLEPDHLDEQYVHFTGRGSITDDQWANWVSDHGMYPVVSYVIEYNPEAVNQAPQFDTLPAETTVKQGDAFHYDIQASDPNGDGLSFTAVNMPSWLTLTDNGDGTAALHGTPGVMDMTGLQNVTLRVSDGTATTDQSFDINVLANQPPVITTTPPASVVQGYEYLYHIEANDPDGEPVSYFIGDLPEWLTFTDHGDGSATLQGTPGLEDTLTSYIQIFATDGMEFSQQSYLLDILPNSAPGILSQPVTQTQYGDMYEYLVQATDTEGDPMNFTIEGDLPDWLTFTDNGDGTALLHGTPDAADAGSSFAVTIHVLDHLGSVASQSFDLHVNNLMPVITAGPDTSAVEDAAYNSTIMASDPESQPLTYECTDLPDWLDMTDNGDGTATLTGTPGEADVGEHTFTLRVHDADNVVEQSYTITVAALPNTAPEITSTPVTVANAGGVYSYTVQAADIDQDALSFSNNTLPDWLTLIDNGDGTAELVGTPDHDDAGTHEVVIEVTDGEVVVQHQFIIDVSAVSEVGRISGVVWHDMNADGVIDDDEERLAGWTVYEDANGNQQFDDGELHVMTDQNGNYLLTELAPGEHDIRVQLENGGSLDDYMIRCNWRSTLLPFGEHEDVRITQIDDDSYVVGFEDWTDADFDDLIVQLDYSEDGQINMTILERNAAGTFDLVDTNGNLLNKGLGQWNKTPVGSVIELVSGWTFSTSNAGGYQLVFESGMIVENADFGVYHASPEPEYDPDFDLLGDLDDYMIRCNWRNTFLPLAEASKVQRTDIDDSSYLLGFEDWIDRDYNDLVLKVEHTDSGVTMVTVVDRNAAGTFDLVDAHTGKKLFHGLGQQHRTPLGTTFRIGQEQVHDDVDQGHDNNGWQHRLQISIARMARTMSELEDVNSEDNDDTLPLDDADLTDHDGDDVVIDIVDDDTDIDTAMNTDQPVQDDTLTVELTADHDEGGSPVSLGFAARGPRTLPPIFNWIRKAAVKMAAHHAHELADKLDDSFNALSDKLDSRMNAADITIKNDPFDVSIDRDMDDTEHDDIFNM